MADSDLLVVDDLSKSYNGKSKALDGINVTVGRGEFVSVIGCSGAGKSTFLRCINRLIDPTEGSIVFNGEDVTKMSKRQLRGVRRRISMIFQHYNLVYRASAIVMKCTAGSFGLQIKSCWCFGFVFRRRKTGSV